MSFILDALKKSENERQRQIGPSLADIPIRRARTDRPWWAFALAALLVVNLCMLAIVLIRDRDSVPAPPAQAAAASPHASQAPAQPSADPAATASAAPSQPRPRPSPAVQSLAEVAGVGAALDEEDLHEEEPYYDPSIASAAVVPDRPPVVRRIDSPQGASSSASFGSQDRSAADMEILPTHGDLIAGGRNLPELRLDIHHYHSDPQRRFVFVNMRKYVEGQTLTEGPTIERIRADGVVLTHQNQRFLLPRQ